MRASWIVGVSWIAIGLLPGTAGAAGSPDVSVTQQRILERGLDWTAGETRFTRMGPAERARLVVPGRPPVPWERWLKSRAEPADGPAVPPDFRAAGIDWRDHFGYNWDTPIRDQGSCGSCWAFSTVAAVEMLVAWRRSTPDPTLDLSEQQLFDCSMDSIDCETGGITWYTTGSFLFDTGLTSEDCYPYTSGRTGAKGTCPVIADMTTLCQNSVIKTDDLIEVTETLPGWPWYDPPAYEMSPEAMTLVKAHLQERPVGASYRVYDDFYSYTGGVYEPTTSAGGGMHAVLIVGYDDPGGYWIVKNSWGDDFGEGGYFRIRYNTSSFGMFSFVYNYEEDRAAAAFCPDLPERLELGQQGAGEFVLANCGGGALAWTLDQREPWFQLQDARGRAVTNGAEVAAGRTYRVVLTQTIEGGASGTLVLSEDGGQARTILVEVVGDVEPPDGGVADGGDDDPDGGPLTDDDGSGRGAAGCATPGGGAAGIESLWPLFMLFWLRRRSRA